MTCQGTCAIYELPERCIYIYIYTHRVSRVFPAKLREIILGAKRRKKVLYKVCELTLYYTDTIENRYLVFYWVSVFQSLLSFARACFIIEDECRSYTARLWNKRFTRLYEATSYEDRVQRIKNAVIEMQQDTKTLRRAINSVFHRCQAEGHHFGMRLSK